MDDEGGFVLELSPPQFWPSVVEVVLSVQPARSTFLLVGGGR